jgi:hypothetical protein
MWRLSVFKASPTSWTALLGGESLRPEKRCRHDCDPVRAPVCSRSGCNDDRVGQVIPDLSAQPVKVADVAFVWCLPELDLDCEDVLATLDDQVDLAVAIPGT